MAAIIAKLYLDELLSFLKDRNIDIDTIIEQKAVSAIVDTPAPYISVAEFMEVYTACNSQFKGVNLISQWACELGYNSHGFVGFALANCENIKEILELGTTLVPLGCNGIQAEYEETETTGIIRFIEVVPMGGALQLYMEALFSAFKFISDNYFFVDRPLLLKAKLTYPKPADFGSYAHFLPEETVFNSACNELVFEKIDLARPIPNADEKLKNLSLVECESALNDIELHINSHDVVVKLTQYIEANLKHPPSLVDASSHMCMSARTLSRKLLDRELTYKSLQDHIRKTKAIEMLAKKHMYVEEVAFELGFRTPNNFSTTFKRWTNKSPSDFRGR